MKRARDPYDDTYFSSDSEDLQRRKLPEEGIEDEDESPQPSQPPQRKHFCVICEKQFNSGKAYGGHVRIHSTEYNNKGKMKKKPKKMKRKICLVKKGKGKEIDLSRADDDDDDEEKITCFFCEREFDTMNSLFGHMRRHPERTWKGIRPPPQEVHVNDDDDHDSDHNDVFQAACILIMLYCDSTNNCQGMNEAMESPKSEVRCSSSSKDKILDDSEMTDSEMKMETDQVEVNEPQGEVKTPLGFDINQPYHEDDI